jgi:hypothetical protein
VKVNRKNLTNEIRTNEQRELIAEKINAYILKGCFEIKDADPKTLSYTNIPCFDINFKNLYINELDFEKNGFVEEPVQEKKDSEGSDEEPEPKEEVVEEVFDVPEITMTHVNDNMEVVRQYFGLNDSFKKVDQVKNQSMRSLEFIFPEMQEETIEKEEMEIATYGQKKTVLDKSKESSLRHNVKVILLEKNGYDKEGLETILEGSKCLNMCLKKHLDD